MIAFGLLCAACLVAAVAYAGLRTGGGAFGTAPPEPLVPRADREALAAVAAFPHLAFVSMQGGDAFGAVALAPLEAPDGARTFTGLRCDRVHAAAGRGLCLLFDRSGSFFAPYSARTFDADFRTGNAFPLSGPPSRTRISPDGRYGSVTAFASGDSYLEAGAFSTRTNLFDMATGDAIADLEQFTVRRNGARFDAVDFNFWGVTFARDSDRFYATLASGGKTYLVQGSVAARQMSVLRENVECPSLSPDNRRIAYKSRTSPDAWRLHVLDLATLADVPLGETRSVDDQVEWLDDDNLLYGVVDAVGLPEDAANIWVLPVGGAEPRVLVHGALSPAVVRPT
jgi:hypothetical protein